MEDIPLLRLANHHIAGTRIKKVPDLVSHMGAVQAQDYAMAKWGIALRLPGLKEEDVENAINNGEIIRTHILRPTWHFVAARDIRWMTELTAAHVKKAIAPMNKKLGLEESIFKKSNKIIQKVLQKKGELTREEIVTEIKKAGIQTDNLGAAHIMFAAELDMIVCNGKRRGKQFTYALFDQRVPEAKSVGRDEALATLAMKYFVSHGPATLKDFTWWSGLSVADAKLGLQLIEKKLTLLKVGLKHYWFDERADRSMTKDRLFLLPSYDEFIVAYADKTDTVNGTPDRIKALGNGIFKPIIIRDGKAIGSWRRTEKGDKVSVELSPLLKLPRKEKIEITQRVEQYALYLGKTATVQTTL